MLTLLFPPFYCWFLAPFALVPFCIAIIRRPLSRRNLLAYYCLGVGFFLVALYWIAPVTILGFIALAMFVALYFLLFAIAANRLIVQLRLPATLAVPIAWTAVEYLRASFVLGGFPWFLLGNCLTPAPVLLQAADLLGVWGLTFWLAMLNGFFVDLLRLPLWKVLPQGKRFSPAIGRLIAIASLSTAFVVSYGVFRLGQKTTTPGPRVAVLQENIPQSLKEDPKAADRVFLRYLALNDQALAQQPAPDLVAWPETMVTAPINEELVRGMPDPFTSTQQLKDALEAATAREDAEGIYLRTDDIYKALADRSRDSGTALLLGYGAYVPRADPAPSILQNRTMLIVPAGAETRPGRRWMPELQRAAEYSKVHLVPFGEFIPFRDVPGVKQLMRLFSPVDFDYTNTPGTQWTRFTLTDRRQNQRFTFGTPICFEDTMPYPARMMTAALSPEKKKADFLVNVSNDGWFLGVELDQHLQACQLRAVENRVSIARAVNTGNSGFIDSNGRIMGLVRGSDGRSIGAVGTLAMIMPIDSRQTLYGRVGDLLPIVCGLLGTILVGWTFARPRRR
jgi:apolipoprotein N-acyltransferase